MKKWVPLLFVLVLVLSLGLAGCGSSDNGGDNAEGKTDTSNTNDQTDVNENEQNDNTNQNKEQVTIKWATWMGQEEAERYIKAFEETHPHIKVEKDPAVDWPWNEKLAAVAAAGELPDVMWTFGVPVAVTNGWLEDLTPFLETDPEFKEGKSFMNLNDTAKYNGKQYALPHSLYMFAINLNLDLFEKENVPIPPVNWTVEDMREAARALTKYNEHQFGLNNIKGMRETLPSSFNPNFDWNTWDGEKFNFTSSDFKRTVDYVDNLLYSDQVSLDTAKPEEREQWYGKDKDPWILGKIGMQYDGTWSIPYNIENANFKWDIRPLPAESSQRIPLIADYVGISKSSQHKEAAFEFVKWLTYSKEGWMKRLQSDWPLSSIPLINDEEVWNLYLNNENMPEGMRELLNMISDGFVDPIKWLPGYIDALNIYGETFKLVEEREAKLEDIVADMEKRMNDAYNSAVEQLNNAN